MIDRGTTKYAKGAKMGMQIVFKEETYKIIVSCSENRTPPVCKPNPFALLACFVVEREDANHSLIQNPQSLAQTWFLFTKNLVGTR
jgi:hypothetical protein